MRLHEKMQTLEISVRFHALFNNTLNNNSWLGVIELFIDYSTEVEYLQGMCPGLLKRIKLH